MLVIAIITAVQIGILFYNKMRLKIIMYLCVLFVILLILKKKDLTEHMMLIHDIPSEELTKNCCLLTRNVNVAIHRIFFKVKKLQMKILSGKCQVVLCTSTTKGRKITAGELKQEGALDKLCHANDGYRFLRALRRSPPYFEKAKKDLFAMIRQLGPTTLFCSFSAAEWHHLIINKLKFIPRSFYKREIIIKNSREVN